MFAQVIDECSGSEVQVQLVRVEQLHGMSGPSHESIVNSYFPQS
jgi:hypothetical protein